MTKLQEIKLELKRLRHEPIARVGEWLRKVTTGYYQYHAVPGNLPRLHLFRWRLRWVWWHALSRRGQRRRVPLDLLTKAFDWFLKKSLDAELTGTSLDAEALSLKKLRIQGEVERLWQDEVTRTDIRKMYALAKPKEDMPKLEQLRTKYGVVKTAPSSVTR